MEPANLGDLQDQNVNGDYTFDQPPGTHSSYHSFASDQPKAGEQPFSEPEMQNESSHDVGSEACPRSVPDVTEDLSSAQDDLYSGQEEPHPVVEESNPVEEESYPVEEDLYSAQEFTTSPLASSTMDGSGPPTSPTVGPQITLGTQMAAAAAPATTTENNEAVQVSPHVPAPVYTGPAGVTPNAAMGLDDETVQGPPSFPTPARRASARDTEDDWSSSFRDLNQEYHRKMGGVLNTSNKCAHVGCGRLLSSSTRECGNLLYCTGYCLRNRVFRGGSTSEEECQADQSSGAC